MSRTSTQVGSEARATTNCASVPLSSAGRNRFSIPIISDNNAAIHTASRGKAAAILSIVGAVNLPIIKYSVNWWNTLHQGSTFTVTERPKMPPDMYIPLLLMMLGSYFLVAALTIYRTNTLILQRESSKQWVIDECKRLYR